MSNPYLGHFKVSSLFNTTLGFRTKLKAFGHHYRQEILAIAVLVFITGLFLAVRKLDLGSQDLDIKPLLMALLLTQPILIFLNSLELKLCGHAVQLNMTLSDSVYVSSSATLANILPLPAGLLVRGGALIHRGGALGLVSKVLFSAGIMWMAVAMVVSGAVISGGVIAKLMFLTGLVLTAVLMVYVTRLSHLKIAFGFLFIRTLMVGLLALQLNLCFLVLGEAVSLRASAVYVVSGVAGAVVSIVPAGLGITEAFGAALAKFDGASPAMAYIVLSLNRLIGLAMAGLAFFLFSKKKPKLTVHSKS